MNNLLNSRIGRLRTVAFLEGLTLILLVFIGMPLKYLFNNPMLVQILGPIHGFLFMLFVFQLLYESKKRGWALSQTGIMLLLGSFIPFGTFYVDYKWLKPLQS